MNEFDPSEELGLIHDKQLICGCLGFLVQNNSTKDICKRFISNGDKFYDIVTRYDEILTYVINREDNKSNNNLKYLAPFLKAFGATDYAVLEYCKEKIRVMPESKKVMKYLCNLLPTFISTSSLEHNVLCMCEELDLPIQIIDFSLLSLDSTEFIRQESKALRDFASNITSLRLPLEKYELNVPKPMGENDLKMIASLDEIFNKKMEGFQANNLSANMKAVGANEKAYALLDIRKKTLIDFDGTAYIGGNIVDYHAMDLIKEGRGLSVSFNGCEFGVHGSNVAVMSKDCTVAAVLVQEFYNEGTEAVFDLVSNWDEPSLRKRECPDRSLMDYMLKLNSKKLPEVYLVDRKNVEKIAKKSDEYRKNLLKIR